MSRAARGIVHLLALVGLLTPALAGQSPVDRYQVLLMTMGPGAEVYERFGHNAIVIRDTVARSDLVYNYGTYDYTEPGFIRRFVEGRPRYWLAADSWEHTLALYGYLQRRVDVQELALRPEQKAELAFRLAVNAASENREYLYDYFWDNCSTRVRDMLDQVLGGTLGDATHGVAAEGTLRFHMARSLTNDVAMYAGILTAMGPMADRPLDQWDEMFLPEKVQQRVRELRVADSTGRLVPLVTREATVVDVDVFRVEADHPHWALRFLAVGALLALLIATGVLRGRRGLVGRVVAASWGIVSGVAGLVLLFLWFGTNHVATVNNWNVLTLSPFAMLLVVPVVRPAIRVWGGRVAALLGGMAVLGLVLAHLPGLTHQTTIESTLLTAPPAMALAWVAWVLSHRPGRGPSTPQ